MKVLINKVFLLCLCIEILSAQKLSSVQHVVDKFAADKDLLGASMSICIFNAKTGELVAGFDKERKLIPASIQKLVTCGTALKFLGKNYRYSTPFDFNGQVVTDSLFVGNIVIRGTGDPSFGSAAFKLTKTISEIADTIANILKSNCIKEINGQIIVNSDFIKDIPENPEWLYYDIGNYYGAGIHGFNILENTATIDIEKKENSSEISITHVYPKELSANFRSKVNLLNILSQSREDFFILGANLCDEYQICGNITLKQSFKKIIKASIPNPAFIYEFMLKNQLEERGIQFISNERQKVNSYSYEWYNHNSPDLDEMIKYTLKTSNNLYCESYVHMLGQNWNATTDRNLSIDTFNKYWNKILKASDKIKLVDGSGLSRKNAISSQSMCEVLNFLASKEGAPGILNLIGDAKIEGSLANYLATSKKLKSKMLLKSGSMEGIRAYAGYLLYPNQKLYSISLIINNHDLKTNILSTKISKFLISLESALSKK
ncbi:MAG: D-alanyl-D-alanine carboxypeptidase/D-alanyl-D-alanine-endopeptidase [Saprospiraceae bacterium]|nr:D-alanyl-D-alanine carboxypeptidase/D-alanyl-D-alanine-endopeptidase [Saprospiraceae bacterium]